MRPLISFEICHYSALPQIAHAAAEKMGFPVDQFMKDLMRYADGIKSNVWTLIEYPYVDKLYRDSYYQYFAAKNIDYGRDSIRVSFFSEEVTSESFRPIDEEHRKKLQSTYLGFVTLRPTPTCCVGRCFLHPEAFRTVPLCVMLTPIQVEVYGVEFEVECFPHVTQDTETMTCAEASLWCLMEYYGNRFADYKPVKLSAIHRTLREIIYERQLPSTGLTAVQLGYALRKFGFTVKLYHSKLYEPWELRYIFNDYIESGIPFIAGLTLKKEKKEKKDTSKRAPEKGHSIIMMGHEGLDTKEIFDKQPVVGQHLTEDDKPNGLFWQKVIDYRGRRTTLTDSAEFKKRYIAIDDNHAPYRPFDYENPKGSIVHPNSPDVDDVTVDYLIVPLNERINVDSVFARTIFQTLLSEKAIWDEDDSASLLEDELVGDKLITRVFLASSRSYKAKLVKNADVDSRIKEIVIGISMPRFVWVIELSTVSLYTENKALGVIVIDATEAAKNCLASLIFAIYPKRSIVNAVWSGGKKKNTSGEEQGRSRGKSRASFIPINQESKPFGIYINNLQNLPKQRS